MYKLHFIKVIYVPFTTLPQKTSYLDELDANPINQLFDYQLCLLFLSQASNLRYMHYNDQSLTRNINNNDRNTNNDPQPLGLYNKCIYPTVCSKLSIVTIQLHRQKHSIIIIIITNNISYMYEWSFKRHYEAYYIIPIN